jgi:uncharacterized caspase-like protein
LKHALCVIGAACWALAVAFAGPAEAKRVALVIGNTDYKVGPLANPGNDAAAIAEALERQLKFDTVILKRNLGADAFRAALRELARQALGAEYGVVFFAGHGIEVDGRNFLIPTDATLAAARDIELEAIALDTVLGQLDGVTKLKLVILDACRNNPFALAGPKRSVGRGLGRVEPEGNTLVAYAAKDGTTADDGVARRHSPFTEALLKHIATPGLEIRQLFGYVRDDVAAITAKQQQPYLYGSLGGQGVFLHPQSLALQSPTPAPGPPPQMSEAERAWAAVKDSTSMAVLEAFRRQYGAANAVYDRLAEARIEELKRQPPAPATPPPGLARQLQVELQRVGCNPGAIDGEWGDRGEAALQRFARHAKLDIHSDEPTLEALEAVKGQRARVCPPESATTRQPAKAKTTPAVKRAQQKEKDSGKSGMCWAVDPRGMTSTLVPCTDSRSNGIRAY